jgi:uncharacterized RDD family membrane protein YckC
MSDRIEPGAAEPIAYGRFSRRVKAVVTDQIIIMALLVAALFVAVSAGSDHIGRILGFTFLAVLLLYEPLLVSLTGSTIGHYRANLRVVDNRSGGNISFIKAVVRVIIKSVLGIYSFITMATTSRHQAVHDLLTRSTVQIRDRSRARAGEYVTARTLNPGMPSIGRRILVIVAYAVASAVLVLLIAVALAATGLLSDACVDLDVCSPLERTLSRATDIALIGLPVLCIVQGWRGRLYGARVRRERPA